MPLRYTSEEIAFDVPDGWTDRSTTKFVFPEVAADVSLSRTVGVRGMPLEVCAIVQLHRLRAKTPGLRVLDRRIEPGRWLQLTVEWREGGTRMHAVLRSMVVDDELWTLVARAPTSAADECGHVIERTMESFALRE